MNDEMKERFTPHKCPVCNSFGTLKYGKIVCHGCKGKGYIVIDNRNGLPVDDMKLEK